MARLEKLAVSLVADKEVGAAVKSVMYSWYQLVYLLQNK